jgi:hypothetical protein
MSEPQLACVFEEELVKASKMLRALAAKARAARAGKGKAVDLFDVAPALSACMRALWHADGSLPVVITQRVRVPIDEMEGEDEIPSFVVDDEVSDE